MNSITRLQLASMSPRQGKTRSTAGYLLASATLLLCAACASAPPATTEENWMDYLDAVDRLEAGGPALRPASDEETTAVSRFKELLQDFKAPDFKDRIREVYAEDVFFNDTLKTIRGVHDLEEYLAATGDAIDEGTVEFLDLVASDGNYYFRWVMTIRFKRFAKGQETRSVGMSHIRFDSEGKVVLHQDFWDSSGGLFEHIPGIGWMLRRTKSRL